MADKVEQSANTEIKKPTRKKAAQGEARSSEKANSYRLPNKRKRLDLDSGSIYSPTRVYLPEKVIPDKKHILILQQGQEGNAVGTALAGLINYLTSRGGQMYHASPRMIYEVAKTFDGTGGSSYDPGATLASALYGLTEYGVANDTIWPYVPEHVDRELTPERAQAASQFKAISFASIPKDRDALRTAIVEYGAIVCGAAVHNGWMQTPASVIPFTGSETILGGHAFPILGYTQDGFIVQLAWGTKDYCITLDGEDFPGLVLWTYPDFEKNFSDAWVVEIPGGVRRIAGAQRASYTADNAAALSFSDDQLNVAPDVRAICALLAARDIQPPLALGLFGNWGTGKSFFMRLMQLEIKRLAEVSRQNPRKTPFYERIVQIEFNAWHFLDTNLWASLVSEIFSRLHEQINTSPVLSADRRKELLKRLGEAEGIYRHSRLEFEEAQRAQQNAQQVASAAEEQLAKKQQRLRVYQEIEQKSSQAAQAFGIPLLAQSTTRLADAARLIENTPTRLGKIWKMVRQSPERGKLLGWLAVILLGPLLLGWLAGRLTPEISGALRQLAQAAVTGIGWLAAIGGWLAPRLAQMDKGISSLEDAAAQIQSAPEVKDQSLADLQAQIQEGLAQTQEKENDAREKLEESEKNVAELQRELEELNPRWQMQQFILTRSGSEDYSKQLGLVSLIRRDFEQLSQLLRENQEAEQEAAEAAGQTEAANGQSPDSQDKKAPPALPFQRIILYIDDLDRCSPERVVEVLEAVHLLLAFPLFIVVVAVDPRWLRTCLEIRYKELLKRDDSGSGGDSGFDQTASPQDYLEKIFQIPFYLRPLSRSNFTSMVQGLLGTEVVATDQKAGAPTGKLEPAGDQKKIGVKPAKGEPQEETTDAAGDDQAEPEARKFVPKISQSEEAEINPDRLKLEKIELDDMLQFSALFRTPRAVKRFINTYRLVRVGIRPEALAEFVNGSEEKGVPHRVAMALLAVVAGYPNVAPHFLSLLLDQMRAPEPAKSWPSFLKACRDAGPGEKNSATVGKDNQPSTSDAEWQGLCEALESLSLSQFLPEDLSAYYDLIPPVARFSFSVSDLPGLRKKS